MLVGFWIIFDAIFGDFLVSRWPLGPFLGASWGRSRFLVVFGGLLGPLLGAMLRHSRPPKLSKVTFFDFLTLPKAFKGFLRLIWDSLGTVLRPFWARFWKILEAKIDVTTTLTKKSKLSPRRCES